MPFAYNYHICNKLLCIFAKLTCLGKKSLILIQPQTSYYQNSLINSSFVFLDLDGDRLDLNKVKSNAESDFLHKLLNVDIAASEFILSTFYREIGNTISFEFFFNGLLYV